MIAAVVERRLDIDHRIAGENAALHGFLHALIDRLDVFLRHRAPDDLVNELVAFARFIRIEADLGVSVLAASASLPDVLAFRFGMPANGLAIRHLWLADVGLDLVLAHHAVHNDFEVQFAHAADDGLPAVGIGVHFEGWIFLRQFAQRHAHLFLVGLGLGLDRH